MKIAVASDHAGYELKKDIAGFLADLGIDILDLGCGPGEKVDYVDYAAKAARSVVSGESQRAILFCGSSLGMAIVANKFPGIRATPCWNDYSAEMSRRHNDSNCLTLGGRVLGPEEARRIVSIWLETPFDGGRHAARLAKITALESELYK
jgi:ribose 5-phosphate isomerase B